MARINQKLFAIKVTKSVLENEGSYNLRSRHPDFDDYFTQWRLLSSKARNTLACKTDIPYGSGQNMTLDFFPAAGSDSPLLIFIHGGYWRSLDKSDHSFPALGFVPNGVSFASINYALAPSITLDEIVDQCRVAISWLYNNAKRLGSDPLNIHICGHSAGGHLTAMMMLTDWRKIGIPSNIFQSATPISGVFDLRPLLHTSINEDLKMDEKIAIKNSPILQFSKTRINLLTAVGLDETKAFIEQSSAFSSFWEETGSKSKFLGVPNTHHFNIITALSDREHPLTLAIYNNIKRTV